MTMTSSRTAEIRAVAANDRVAAEGMLASLLSDLFRIAPTGLRINADQYSLYICDIANDPRRTCQVTGAQGSVSV